jgi:nucleoid-associated protein YgaU
VSQIAWALALVVAAGAARAQAPPSPPPAPAPAASAENVHVVRTGETLAEIAQATLGDAKLWPHLYRANRDQIRDPAVVYPGQRLTIPRVEAPAEAPRP